MKKRNCLRMETDGRLSLQPTLDQKVSIAKIASSLQVPHLPLLALGSTDKQNCALSPLSSPFLCTRSAFLVVENDVAI